MPIKFRARNRRSVRGVVRGVLAAITETGETQVDFPMNVTGLPVPACSTVPVRAVDVGREAVLMFEDGDLSRPILLGFVETPGAAKIAEVDAEQITIRADREIVLRCGEASITLTQAGKVIIRGAYVASRSSGVNRVKGASVQIN